MAEPPDPPAALRVKPKPPGDGGLARRVEEMLRVDHAGEYGAVAIYRGQRAVFARAMRTRSVARAIHGMERQERAHLDAFDTLLLERRVRPTALAPVWNVAGYALGVATALLGARAAHACTEAVESVIERHYGDQVDELERADAEPELKATFAAFRADELAHKEEAIEAGARDAPGYPLLSALIRMGCRAAIKLSEKV
jgi:ubiquinone biosynthesis monooxygenase Coq7